MKLVTFGDAPLACFCCVWYKTGGPVLYNGMSFMYMGYENAGKHFLFILFIHEC